MTIAAGFVCRDGVVLCADSRMTGYLKQSGPKLWSFPPGHAIAVAVTGATSDGPLLAAARDLIFRAATPTQMDALVASIEASLTKWYARPQPAASRPELYLLIALRTADEIALFETSDGALGRVHPARCLGSGGDVATYLSETAWRGPQASSEETRAFVAHMLAHVKKYCPECGGESTILVIPHVGDVELATPYDIDADERYCETLWDRVRDLSAWGMDRRESDRVFNARLDGFVNAIRSARVRHADPSVYRVMKSAIADAIFLPVTEPPIKARRSRRK